MPTLTISLPQATFQTVVDACAVRYGATGDDAKNQAARKKFVEDRIARYLVAEAQEHMQNEAAAAARKTIPELSL